MPHLDASALTSDDPKGLEFLACVIEVPQDHAKPSWIVADLSPRKTAPIRPARRRKAPAHAVEPA
ncbi:hypothetical protein [Enterovirga rhinocerotis]|uniref:Uncharacterized protein n=1 Tax=Enterovirga rhinocerotis TaxID=1339210 RepID=A0A4R7BTQ9_9HYPH|nr:hypothetical protein [Enterovirga rhinocerotis]TDR89138.1 hypothetical protein EV668_3626 [Enterovirga rhinocerotis]